MRYVNPPPGFLPDDPYENAPEKGEEFEDRLGQDDFEIMDEPPFEYMAEYALSDSSPIPKDDYDELPPEDDFNEDIPLDEPSDYSYEDEPIDAPEDDYEYDDEPIDDAIEDYDDGQEDENSDDNYDYDDIPPYEEK